MDNAVLYHEEDQPQILSPSNSGRRRSDSNTPEFEFWMVRNPSFPQPNLLSADELFVDGVLLPLDLVPHSHEKEPEEEQPDPPDPNTRIDAQPEPQPGPELASITNESAAPLTASKRWRDIFKRSDKKSAPSNSREDKEKDKEKKKEKRSQIGANSAELNINIWPFSRSRSAGNGGTRPRAAPTRKVSSAPCSRSNSSGRKWPSSPGRNGVHLGRSSPVWQVRRGTVSPKNGETVGAKKEQPVIRRNKEGTRGSPRAKVLNLKVPMCIGYKTHLSCRSDENSSIGGGGGNDGDASVSGSGGSGSGNIFSLRSLFTKKVH